MFMCLTDWAKLKIHLHCAKVSKGPAVRSEISSLTVSFPPATVCQSRLWCSWMDGQMNGCNAKSPGGLWISGAQLNSQFTSTSVGAPFIKYTPTHNHYILPQHTLKHTPTHTPPITSPSQQIGGGRQAGCETSWSSAQTKKPAECAFASKRLRSLTLLFLYDRTSFGFLSLFLMHCVVSKYCWRGVDYESF